VRSLVNYLVFMRDLSRLIGCSPRRYKTLLNPKLLYKLIFGSHVSFMYRLHGPGKLPEQSKEILYRLPVVFPVWERLGLSVLYVFGKVLESLRLIPRLPSYC
jgi:hypothetical protein